MKDVTIYTDGSCHGNPGPGGYAAVVRVDNATTELSRGFQQTTNNRMELMAAIVSLQSLTDPASVDLYTDSQYVKNGLEKGWAVRWRSNHWKKGPRLQDEVKNPDLWDLLLTEYERHQVTLHWVKGHAGDENNERCDELANEAASGKDLAEDDGFGAAKPEPKPEEQGELF